MTCLHLRQPPDMWGRLSAGWSTMYPQDEEYHQRHIAEYVYHNIAALAGMPPSLYNRAARFFFHITPSRIFNWSMRCGPAM